MRLTLGGKFPRTYSLRILQSSAVRDIRELSRFHLSNLLYSEESLGQTTFACRLAENTRAVTH